MAGKGKPLKGVGTAGPYSGDMMFMLLLMLNITII